MNLTYNETQPAQEAWLFPGGGCQYVGMGKALYDNFAMAREAFEEAEDLLKLHLAKTCFEGPLDTLSSMEYAQPAIFVVSLASYRVYTQELGKVPGILAGHSLGEYTALCAAGVFSLTDALQLVGIRGELLKAAGIDADGTMMAVNKLPVAQVEAMVKVRQAAGDQIYMAVYNAPFQVVVSGQRQHLENLGSLLEAEGGHINMLPINTPSHCPLMQTAADHMRNALEDYTPSVMKVPVVANLTGEPYQGVESVIDTLTTHMIAPVRWEQSMRYMQAQGYQTYTDVGPRQVLEKMTEHILTGATAYSLDNNVDVDMLYATAGKTRPNLYALMRAFEVMAISTPDFGDDTEGYAERVGVPFERLQAKARAATPESTDDHMVMDAYQTLTEVWDGKAVPTANRTALMDYYLVKTGTQGRFGF